MIFYYTTAIKLTVSVYYWGIKMRACKIYSGKIKFYYINVKQTSKVIWILWSLIKNT